MVLRNGQVRVCQNLTIESAKESSCWTWHNGLPYTDLNPPSLSYKALYRESHQLARGMLMLLPWKRTSEHPRK